MFGNEDSDFDDNLFPHLPDEITFLNSDNLERKEPLRSTFNNSKSAENADALNKRAPKKVILKRKFPGPAGLFPETNAAVNTEDNDEDQNSFLLGSQFLCSQSSNLTFHEPTWLDMRKDFNQSILLKTYNIEWIKSNITCDLIDKKVPFLIAIIKQVKNTSKSPILVLADHSGEIEALITTELYEDYNKYLIINSVVVLRRFGILSVGSSKHYVNITIDNLIRIYSCTDVSDDYVNIVHIQEITNDDLERDVNEFVRKYDGRNIQSNHNYPIKVNTGSSKLNHQNIDQPQRGKLDKSPEKNLDCLGGGVIRTRRFNFKNILSNNANINSPTTSLNSRNIFEHTNNPVDLDLRIDDFQDDFSLPFNSNYDNENKKRKVDRNITNTFNGSDHKEEIIVKDRQIKIDCSQISIISQNNNEDSDIIKEVFSDLDASALFDDF